MQWADTKGQTRQTKKDTCSGQTPKDKPGRLRRTHVVGRHQRLEGQGPRKSRNEIASMLILKGILKGLKGTVAYTFNCMGEVISAPMAWTNMEFIRKPR